MSVPPNNGLPEQPYKLPTIGNPNNSLYSTVTKDVNKSSKPFKAPPPNAGWGLGSTFTSADAPTQTPPVTPTPKAPEPKSPATPTPIAPTPRVTQPQQASPQKNQGWDWLTEGVPKTIGDVFSKTKIPIPTKAQITDSVVASQTSPVASMLGLPQDGTIGKILSAIGNNPAYFGALLSMAPEAVKGLLNVTGPLGLFGLAGFKSLLGGGQDFAHAKTLMDRFQGKYAPQQPSVPGTEKQVQPPPPPTPTPIAPAPRAIQPPIAPAPRLK